MNSRREITSNGFTPLNASDNTAFGYTGDGLSWKKIQSRLRSDFDNFEVDFGR